ncbi:MAG TPA: hypothetical protein PLK99_10880, partial [Burkholderiales bacterium]|nr:hypothetical protein [Burkholderiales bacterium]
MSAIMRVFAAVLMAFCFQSVQADEGLLKPFVLGSKGPGDLNGKVDATKKELASQGFVLAGSYSPYPDTVILVVTNDELKKNAAQSDMGGFGAMERVSVVKSGGDIQVSYMNPVYMANAYRMKGDLSGVAS